MAQKRDPDHGYAVEADPGDEVVHLHVAKGETVVYQDQAFGDRGTLQVRRGDLDRVKGKYDEVDPDAVPDAAER
jgi:hypothetical protein